MTQPHFRRPGRGGESPAHAIGPAPGRVEPGGADRICRHRDTIVVDGRPHDVDGLFAIRRRRECNTCYAQFSTLERLTPLVRCERATAAALGPVDVPHDFTSENLDLPGGAGAV